MLFELSSADLDNIMKIVLQFTGNSGRLENFRISRDGYVHFEIIKKVPILPPISTTIAVSFKKVSDRQLNFVIHKLSGNPVMNGVMNGVLKCLFKFFGKGIKSKMPNFIEVVSERCFEVDLDKLAKKFCLPVSFTLHDITQQENRFFLQLDIVEKNS